MTYEASVRGEVGPVLSAAFADCDVVVGRGITAIRFVPNRLREVLDRFQEFGLDLVDLRLRVDPGTDAMEPPR